jgi:hypothetical protein
MPTEAIMPLHIPLGFALALAIGGAVGLEGERHARVVHKPTFGGARTFPLVALLGEMLAMIGRPIGPTPLSLGLLALATLLALSHWNARSASGDLH